MTAGPGNVKTAERALLPVLQALAARALDLLYPPVCIACDAPVAGPGVLCPACWAQMRPITPPMCPRLGLPFEVSLGADALSAEAIADPPPFDRARSAVIYDAVARSIVSRLKYGDRPELARFCARIMVAGCGELLDGDPVLVPVPLHGGRQLRRRYNQSSEIARALGRDRGLDMAPLLVRRVRATRPQVGLSAASRDRNVAGAFAVDAREAGRWAGRRLVLVDDVITTGATVKAMTRALRRAGFGQIDVVSFARVVVGQDMPI